MRGIFQKSNAGLETGSVRYPSPAKKGDPKKKEKKKRERSATNNGECNGR